MHLLKAQKVETLAKSSLMVQDNKIFARTLKKEMMRIKDSTEYIKYSSYKNN